jgi:hypothetical protein
MTDDREAFDHYLSLENIRCKEYGLSEPSKVYLTSTVLNDAISFPEKIRSPLIRMLVGICSASSIVALRAVLGSLRKPIVLFQPPAAKLSMLERFSANEASENQITAFTMLKWCHVLKFWENHGAQHESHDGWIFVDAS